MLELELDVFECVDWRKDRGGVWLCAGMIDFNDRYRLEAHYRMAPVPFPFPPAPVSRLFSYPRNVADQLVVTECRNVVEALQQGVMGWEGAVFLPQVVDPLATFYNVQLRIAVAPFVSIFTVH